MTTVQEPAAHWDKEQLRIDDGSEDPISPRSEGEPAIADHVADVEADPDRDWNKGQMAIDDGDQPQPWIDPDTMLESEMGPTGGRANPGGGRRFGEIDDSSATDIANHPS